MTNSELSEEAARRSEEIIKSSGVNNPRLVLLFNLSFVEGAQWRINSVWHTYEEAKDVDLERTDIVIVMYPHNIYKIGKLSLYQHKKTNPEKGMQEIVQEVALEQPNNMVCLLSRCKGWAYIKDLIPTEE